MDSHVRAAGPGTEPMRAAVEPLLRIVKGGKVYGGLHALQDVDFDVRAGEIHALLGENGAGKSTLCKAIAGAITLTSGDYLIDGRNVRFESPLEALEGGVAMVYQESSLVPSMTVAQNLELGMERLFTVYSRINIAATQALQSLNFNVDALAVVENLGTAKRQMVEIVRAVRHNARIFIFDEPTASLTPEETQHLFHLLNTLKEQGAGIIFISHALEEALQVADRITVLRDGRLVGTAPADAMTRDKLVRMMIGREETPVRRTETETEAEAEAAAAGMPAAVPRAPRGEKVLSVENVTMGSIVKNMSFSLFAGEVVGVFGLVGAGRSEIAQIVCGARKRNFLRGGMIYLRDKPIRYRVPRQAVRDGIAYITEDRKVDGFFESMTVDQNIYMGFLSSPRVRRVWYSAREMKRVADKWIASLSISALKRSLKIIEYSGGNQQKVVLAKSLAQEPSVVIFDEPTRGVDVSAIPQIHAAIRRLADENKAVMVISSYLPEILAISDRILVARGGRIVEEMSAEQATEDKIMYAAIH
ncbi:MAG: sugar ABC transporter ATP-binding protein [Burkholderiaceae bacterium]